MYVRFPTYAPVVLFLACLTTACDDSSGFVSPGALVPMTGPSVTMTAEPAALQPEFLHGSVCPGRSAFG